MGFVEKIIKLDGEKIAIRRLNNYDMVYIRIDDNWEDSVLLCVNQEELREIINTLQEFTDSDGEKDER